METNQIYELVNEVADQSIGKIAIKAVDEQGLISLGNVILSSQTNTEAFYNTLLQRIGKTIISRRKYRNKNKDMVLNDFQYGAILQKIKLGMPESEPDASYDLSNGDTVDHYKVNKLDVKQKFFVTRSPYMFHITTQDEHLREAFLSESAMSGFISAKFEQVRNKIEFSLEALGRNCLANFMAETSKVVNLVTDFNALTGRSLTATTALFDEEFLRYSVNIMKKYSRKMTDLSELYNDGSIPSFTPKELQRIKVLSDFITNLETTVQYAAFHDEFVTLDGFSDLNYWQSAQEPMSISVNRASDGTATKIENIVGCIYDHDALGIYKIEEKVATTPLNASGLYYNTYWHEKQLWFNDLSENFVLFTLN